MEVKDIIDLNTIKTNMSAKSKEEAIQELAEVLLQDEYITDINGFLKDIYALSLIHI